MAEQGWRSTEVLAWTEREGPGRPPAGPSRLLSAGMAGALGVVFVGILATDALCPEHRALVQAIAGLAVVSTVVAMVGLVRQSPSAPLLTLCTAMAGVSIGVIDAVHDPGRGTFIALGFGVVVLGSCALAWRQLRLTRWERSTLTGLRGPNAETAVRTPAATAATPAAGTPAAAERAAEVDEPIRK